MQERHISTPSVPEMPNDAYALPLSDTGRRAYSILCGDDEPCTASGNSQVTPPDQFSKTDRDRVLQLMFSDPTVVAQLCAKKSPGSAKHARTSSSAPGEPATSAVSADAPV